MKNFSEQHPSRRFRFCTACGSPDFTFDGVKLFTCSACGFTFYINPVTATAAILEDADGRIVLTRRKHEPRSGCLDLPGGFVDINESAEDAIRREIREELGIELKSLRLFVTAPNEYVFNGLIYFTCDLGFICTSDSLDMMKPDDDVSETILVRPSDINFNEIGFPSIAKIIELYIQQKNI